MTRLSRLPAARPKFSARRNSIFFRLVTLGVFACALLAGPAFAETAAADRVPQTPTHMVPKGFGSWWLPPTHSTHGPAVDQLFTWIFWITMVTLVGVHAVMLYFLIKYRGRKDKAKGVFLHGNTRLEIAWTIAPAIILAVVALASKRVWDRFRYADPANEKTAVNVLVIGEQFQWNFVYPGPDNKIGKYLAFPRPTDPAFRKYPAKEVIVQVNKAIGENPLGQFRPSDAVDAEVQAYDAALTELRTKLSASAAAALEDESRNPALADKQSTQVRTEIAVFNRGLDQLNAKLSSDAKTWRDTRDDDYVLAAGSRPLILPVDTPLNIWLSAKDVIHDFYMPNMRVKLDAVPGMRGEINFTATPDAQSTEVRDLNDPDISRPGAEYGIWVDAHTANAAKQPDNSYALVDPRDKTKVLAASLTTHATPEVLQALKEAGINKITVVSKPWDLVCEELCGQGHTTMRGEVIIVSKQQYWDFIHKPDVATTQPAKLATASAPALLRMPSQAPLPTPELAEMSSVTAK